MSDDAEERFHYYVSAARKSFRDRYLIRKIVHESPMGDPGEKEREARSYLDAVIQNLIANKDMIVIPSEKEGLGKTQKDRVTQLESDVDDIRGDIAQISKRLGKHQESIVSIQKALHISGSWFDEALAQVRELWSPTYQTELFYEPISDGIRFVVVHEGSEGTNPLSDFAEVLIALKKRFPENDFEYLVFSESEADTELLSSLKKIEKKSPVKNA